MTPRTTLFVSIDTEEDNWTPAREGVTVENIRQVPRLAALFDRLDVRASWFVTYQVASRADAAAVLRDVHAAGRCELAAHLHPWNTPPTPEPLSPRLTMTKNLDYDLQLAKLRALTDAIHAAFGTAPVSFRAGRWGLGPETVRALVECGYEVDGSVTPTVDWSAYDDGPNFENAPVGCHWLATSTPDQRLCELPNSFGYSRTPYHFWNRVHGALADHSIGRNRLLGLASRLGVVRKIVLTPELSSARDMLLLSRRLLAEGVRHLQLFLHSPTLQPGLTPYTPTAAHVDRFLATIEAYIEGLCGMATVRFATMSEAPALLLGHEPRVGSAAFAGSVG